MDGTERTSKRPRFALKLRRFRLTAAAASGARHKRCGRSALVQPRAHSPASLDGRSAGQVILTGRPWQWAWWLNDPYMACRRLPNLPNLQRAPLGLYTLWHTCCLGCCWAADTPAAVLEMVLLCAWEARACLRLKCMLELWPLGHLGEQQL